VLSANAYTLRNKARLAVSLAWVGGFSDAIGFLVIGAFIGNMTGNTATLGARLAQNFWHDASFVAGMIVSFFLGAAFSGVVSQIAQRRWHRSMYCFALACEAILLSLFLLYSRIPHHAMVLGAIGAFAMGLQNATITQIAGGEVRTTHVTGVVTDLGLESAQFAGWLITKSHGSRLRRLRRAFYLSPRHPSVQRLLLLGSIWGSFLTGAVLGVASFHYFNTVALLAPIAFLSFMVVLDLITPIAVVDLVDTRMRDNEFQKFGIDPQIIPATLGIYHVKGSGRPPDLGQLHLRVGRREKIVVLILGSHVQLSENSVHSLHNSAKGLHNADRKLILCIADGKLFRQLQDADELMSELGEMNLCSDPEFAIARAMELEMMENAIGI